MAFVYDAKSHAKGTAATSLTWSHTTTTSDDRILVVMIGVYDGTAADKVVSSVTYAGSNLTRLSNCTQDLASGEGTAAWYMVAPATGANNVVITLAGTCSDSYGHAITFSGAAQTGQPDNSVGAKPASANPQSIAITTTADNCWIVSICQPVSGAATPSAGQTLLALSADQWSTSSYSGPATPAGAKSHGYTFTGNNAVAIAAVSVAPAVLAGNSYYAFAQQ